MAGPLRATLFILLFLSHAATADVPPVETFFRPADIEDAALSPSGRWLALSSVGSGSRVALFVFDLQAKDPPRQIVRIGDADVRDFYWTSDERLVFRIHDRSAGAGDQSFAPGLMSVHRDGSDLRTLVSIGRIPQGRALHWNHTLLFVPPAATDEVIVGELKATAGRDMRILPKRVNAATQRASSLAEGAPDHPVGWWFDPAGEPRVVETVHEGQTTVHWRAPGASGWSVLARHPTLHKAFSPRFVDGAGTLYVTVASGEAGVQELRRFDFATGRPAAEPAVRTPGFDFAGTFITSGATGKAIGIRLVTDGETTVWLDPRLDALQRLADARFPGRINRLSCGRTCDAEHLSVLVVSYSDQDPGSLWVYHEATKQWQFVARMRKDVDPSTMAPLDFHRIRARDGRDLPVWVTRPRGAAPDARGPAVVLVHGGPWIRGTTWHWDAEAQFLASRGYVVIEPEFRGGLGFGRSHYTAGWKQWGRAMQDDLVDAVRWTVDRGWVDPRRVCIAGASYGGYAALMGVVRDADTFRCAAAWVAVTDPRLLFSWSFDSDMNDEIRLYNLPEMIGDPETDAAMLKEIAPAEQASRIKAPVLLAFSGQDRRVPVEHGTKLRDALRAAGQDPVWVLYPDEAHGWLKTETRVDFAKRLERFLGTHLKQSDPAPTSATPVR
jgi:acetyl esterase/lipase